MSESVESYLYIVSTPIGNLGDISHRAVEILNHVALIAAEDTRVTKKLLTHFGINTPLLSLHEHNQHEQSKLIIERLQQGEAVALVSDAGTPMVSDPGALLARNVIDAGFELRAVPGASALLAALVVSALPMEHVAFSGFLPAKTNQRRAQLKEIDGKEGVFILYESPRRILDMLADCVEVLGGERKVVVGRELTKRFETIYRGTVFAVIDELKHSDFGERGEFVVAIETRERDYSASLEEALRIAYILKNEMPASKAAKLAAKITGANRNELYEVLAQND